MCEIRENFTWLLCFRDFYTHYKIFCPLDRSLTASEDFKWVIIPESCSRLSESKLDGSKAKSLFLGAKFPGGRFGKTIRELYTSYNETTERGEMFKNKTIQIDLVKKDQQNNTKPGEAEKSFQEHADVVNDVVGKNILRAGIMVMGYVVLDTARRVIVNATTPQ